MTGTFRLTGAEFKKIFKRPSVFIMALILVVTIFISLYIYNPIDATDETVDYNLSTAQEYYNTFFNEDLANTEIGINNVFNNTNELIVYHTTNTNRKNTLYLYYNDFLEKYNSLNTGVYENIDSLYTIFKNSLENFITTFDNSFENFDEYEHIKFTKNNIYYKSSIDTFRLLLTTAKSTNAENLLNIIKANKYLEILDEEYNNAINYITPTLSGIANSFKNNFYDFDKFIEQEHSVLSAIEDQRKKLLSDIKDFKGYYELLINNNFPIVTINDSTHKELTDAFDYSVRTLNLLTTQGKLSDYTTILTDLKNSNIYNYLVSIAEGNHINLINISQTLLNNYDKVNQIVDKNKTIIKSKIEEHRTDNGINNIQFNITEYKLLSTSYNNYVNDLLINDIASNFAQHDFNKLYGANYKDYNEYQYNERIAANKYYLDTNTYSNSYITNFSFGQNSSNKTNVFDFMYFVLEICAVVITVFAMLQICNLITNETESGTITLLLVRPYKRRKIITAKLLTTIFFVLTFMLFSVIISFVGGMALFGYESTPILAVFNSTNPIVISPILLMIINILTLIIDIIFFVIIALMIAVLFKNFAASITSSFIILIVTYVLNLLFGGTFWYSFLPGANLHLFKFFGNCFVNVGTSSAIVEILSTPIQSSMNILFSGILLLAYMSISLIISYSVFKHRDF